MSGLTSLPRFPSLHRTAPHRASPTPPSPPRQGTTHSGCAHNFRSLAAWGFPVAGVACPTGAGILRVLTRLAEGPPADPQAQAPGRGHCGMRNLCEAMPHRTAAQRVGLDPCASRLLPSFPGAGPARSVLWLNLRAEPFIYIEGTCY